VQEVPSVCAGENPEDTFCAVCHDKFEQFYNEEREEWHLRAAVRIDGKTYHPLCYDDYKVSIFIINFTDLILLQLKGHTKITRVSCTLHRVYCVAVKCMHKGQRCWL
jgi:hypothetical protein